MAYKYVTTRLFESQKFPGVTAHLYRMTEGRRLKLRAAISVSQKRIREIVREQAAIEQVAEDSRDIGKWLELQEEFDGLLLEKINPEWLKWGVKQVEGLEVEGSPKGVDDWADWPSALVTEMLEAVKDESELNGLEKKISESPTISGELTDSSLKHSTATSASEKDSGDSETVVSISRSA